jgi:hypothetical protein
MNLLAVHKPDLATVLDWEEPDQIEEVMSWATEATQHVQEAVLIVPKVSGTIPDIPISINGKEIRIAYSVPSSYGGSPIGLWELTGREIHLLGGSPQKQREISNYVQVVSMDGNMAKKMATSRCLYWSRQSCSKGHWQALDGFDGNGPSECLRHSLKEIKEMWRLLNEQQ